MTREEQKKIADFVRSWIHEITTESGTDKNAHTNEVLRKVADGIEKMDTEPCEDAISRRAALNTIEELKKIHFDRVVVLNKVRDRVLDLPTVTPKQKMGRWIPVSERLPGYGEKVLCWTTYNAFEVGYRDNEWGHDVWTIGKFASGTFRVAAWMPLPEPYKAEGED